jgi:hypothetical protein
MNLATWTCVVLYTIQVLPRDSENLRPSSHELQRINYCVEDRDDFTARTSGFRFSGVDGLRMIVSSGPYEPRKRPTPGVSDVNRVPNSEAGARSAAGAQTGVPAKPE